MAFKMKAGSEGPMKKNFPGAFKKDPIRTTSEYVSKGHGDRPDYNIKEVKWTNPITGKTRTKIKNLDTGSVDVLVEKADADGVMGLHKMKTRGGKNPITGRKYGKTKSVYDENYEEIKYKDSSIKGKYKRRKGHTRMTKKRI